MATETTNLKLNKPDKTDFYNIDLVNENMDKIDKAIGEKANKTDIPTKLPANGGNADTVGGKSANAFISNDINTPPNNDLNNITQTGLYEIRPTGASNQTSNTPYDGWGTCFHFTHSSTYHQIAFFSSDIKPITYRRTYTGIAWTSWREVGDGGNAATLNGVNSRAFMQHYPYGTGVDLKSTVFPQPYSANINEASGTSIGLEASWWHLVYLPHDASGFGAQIVIPLNSHFKPKYRLSFSKEWQPWRPLNDNVFVQAVAPTSPHVNDLWIW